MDTELKAQIQQLEKDAFARYNASEFPQAQVLLKQILALDPKHSLARFYLSRIQKEQQPARPVPPKTGLFSTGSGQPVPPKTGLFSTGAGQGIPEVRTPINPTERISRDEALAKTGWISGEKTRENLQYVASTKRMAKAELFKKPPIKEEALQRESTTKKYRPADIPPEPVVKKTPGLVKVMVVDDSSLMRKVITRILEHCPSIKVVGEATNGEQALEMIPKCNPDVITLDVNMPVMDGVTALKHILVTHNLPVIMLSAYTEEGAVTTFDCLTYGAVDFICKPSREGGSLSGKENEIVQKITKACQVEIKPVRKLRSSRREGKKELSERRNAAKIIVMGAGEGGYAGFLKILPHLPEHLPCAVLAVQYMEDRYFEVFSNYLNQHSRILVKKAEDQEAIREGVCYFVNQKGYLKIQSTSDGYVCQVAKKPDFLVQQNVFNHLLFSAAETYATNTIGVVLAGQGIDGLEGMRELKRVHGTTLAQDPKTCIVPQLCEIAINSGSIDRVVADADFPGVLWHLAKNR